MLLDGIFRDPEIPKNCHPQKILKGQKKGAVNLGIGIPEDFDPKSTSAVGGGLVARAKLKFRVSAGRLCDWRVSGGQWALRIASGHVTHHRSN